MTTPISTRWAPPPFKQLGAFDQAKALCFDVPLVQLQETLKEITQGADLVTISRHLDAICERAGLIAEYIDQRHGWGCGDQGHKKAVKEANRRVKKIRKAIGYTYPDRDVTF